MKYMIYEHPLTHWFAFLPLPARFVEADTLRTVVAGRWFATHAAAIAALPELLDREESRLADTPRTDNGHDSR
jgi:hypothetical protein